MALGDCPRVPAGALPGRGRYRSLRGGPARRSAARSRAPAKPGRGGEQRPGHHPVPDHLARPVDVSEKRLQRAYPLHDARFDQLPLGRRDQPRDQVEREDPLFAGMGEHDALVAEAAIPGLRPPRQVLAGERLQGVIQRPRVRMRQAICPEHLIVGRAARVPVEEAAHKRIRTTGLLPRHSARRYSCETKLVHHAVMAAIAPQARTECKFRRTAEVVTFALAVRVLQTRRFQIEEMT